MPFIRLSDDYNDHPKFEHLTDGAFRLWHQGIGFCRKYQTDGFIPTSSLRGFKAYSPKRAKQLLTPWIDGAHALWYVVEGFGVKVHDYLQWNPSKDEENERRAESKERMRINREERKVIGVAPVPNDTPVRANMPRTLGRTSVRGAHDVLGMGRVKDLPSSSSSEKESEEKPDVSDRAAALLTHYADWFTEHRDGAHICLGGSPLDYQSAIKLCETWDDARLEKLAKIVLTTDETYIAGTDRGFPIFVRKASWADDRLTKWEKEQKAQGVAV